jgi:putative hydrolase of HD superfamily
MNMGMFNIEQTKDDIYGKISKHIDLPGVVKALTDKGTKDFIDIFGQLRFQQRWARTPRIPKTTVLGHSLMVANAIFLHDLDNGASDEQIYNDYYTGLFHDLPEVLTKDVISPVKKNVEGLAELLESYEQDEMKNRIMPLLPKGWHEEMKFIIYDPFEESDHPNFGKRAGKAIKACDLICAFIEANVSARYGVSPQSLEDGEKDLRESLIETYGEMGAKGLIEDFERLKI